MNNNFRKEQEMADFLDRLIRSVKDVPIERVVGHYVELTRRGQYYVCLCPFHADKHLNNFVVTPSKGLYHCFACNNVGNGITFVREYQNVGFLDAVFEIAEFSGILSPEEARKYRRRKYDDKQVERIRRQLEEEDQKKKVIYPKADPLVCHTVYYAMARVCGLSEKHKKHLLEERRLPEERLGDFFTFPTKRMKLADEVLNFIRDAYAKKLYHKEVVELSEAEASAINEKVNLVKEQMPIVPGFYRNDRGEIDFISYRGIGILVRNDTHRIAGIQVRRDTCKDNESRYIWFSSLFAQGIETLEGGAASGSPGGVVFPYDRHLNPPSICITEGRFKAEKIAEKGNIGVYVSGVSTWKSILPMVERIADKWLHDNRQKTLFLVFDADQLKNPEVNKSLAAMADGLMAVWSWRECKVIIWNPEHGKGFDDLCINKGASCKSFMKAKPLAAFMKMYDENLALTLKTFNAESVRDIKKQDVDGFKEALLLKNLETFELN